MVKVASMRKAKRILLIASMLVLGVGGASASLWRHRTPKKPAEQPAPATAAAAMTLNAIEVGSSSSPQIVLRTSGAPAFTSLSPTPDQFVIDRNPNRHVSFGVGRTIIALLENGQHEDGSVTLPEVLAPLGAPERLEAAG